MAKMTKSQALIELEKLFEADGDQEKIHVEADKILLRLLEDNGFGTIAETYKKLDNEVDFWYA